MSLILKNTTFIHRETLDFSGGHIKVEEGPDGSFTFYKDFGKVDISPEDEVVDCGGKLVMRSFAVGHHHAYSALARGMPPPVKTPENFLEILKYIWWNLDKALDRDSVEASALATAIACAKAGATFVIDHHASPNFIGGSLELIAQAFDKVGVSHLLCYEITDRDGLDKAEKGLEETERYLRNNQGLVGLHASFTVSDDTLSKAVGLMQKYNSGIHIHVAEDEYDQQQCMTEHGKRVVERLHDFGVLESSKTILGHCLHLTDTEREIVKNSEAFIVQNTESNLNNNVGFFSSKGLGNRIMLGTDGMHSDMIRSAQAAYFVGQSKDEIDFRSAYDRFVMVHNYLKVNKFSGDGDNNLVVLDYESPTEVNQNNFLGHFIFGFSSRDVQHVISDGRLIVKDKKVCRVNEEEVMEFAREQAEKLWKKL